MKYQTLVVALLIGATQSVSLNTMFRPPVYDKKPEKVQEVTVDEEFEETMSSIKESENEKHHLLKTPEKDNTKVGIDAEDPKQGLEPSNYNKKISRRRRSWIVSNPPKKNSVIKCQLQFKKRKLLQISLKPIPRLNLSPTLRKIHKLLWTVLLRHKKKQTKELRKRRLKPSRKRQRLTQPSVECIQSML